MLLRGYKHMNDYYFMSTSFGETCRLVYNFMYDFLLYAYVGVCELLLTKCAE
jgi:hypothetical protein